MAKHWFLDSFKTASNGQTWGARPDEWSAAFGAVASDVPGQRITGTAADEWLTGTAGDDTIEGLGGFDQLFARDGDDELFGGDGGDKLYCGYGNDRAWGGMSNDVLFGDPGDDDLHGEPGNDHLLGDSGNDTLWGGTGKDILNGGIGADVLLGGYGWADEFAFINFNEVGLAPGTRDIIVDFEVGLDKIALGGMDADIVHNGNNVFRLSETTLHDGKPGSLRVVVVNGNTYVMADRDGDRVSDFAIQLEGIHQLTATDFYL
jgi:Ca2+-binding RTX toxin-like protein